jgi:hypothetical protein
MGRAQPIFLTLGAHMKTVVRPSSTGGTLIETFNEDGVRVSVQHKAGNVYSGKIAAVEAKKTVDKTII